MSISRMQQRFIEELLSDPKRNQKQAAIRAGYEPGSAGPAACRLLQKDEVKRAISEREQVIRKKLGKAAEKAFVTEAQVISGIWKSIDDALASGVGAWQAQTVQRGYEMLGRHLGMFTDKLELSQDEKIVAALTAGRERARGIGNEEEADEKKDGVDEPKPN
jgi:phage terminase small subunit